MSSCLYLNPRIETGMVLTAAAISREEVMSRTHQIEAAGFDSLWVGDHIAFHIPKLESLSLLAFVAAITDRIQLGTAIYLLPLRQATLAAKIIGSVDYLSNGRLTLGIGVGGEYPPEFAACGIPLDQRGARTDEAMTLLRRLWREDNVAFDGEFTQFDSLTLEPKPLSPGGPRMLVGGRRGPTFRRAGRLGDGYISHMCSAGQFKTNLTEIGRQAALAGRTERTFATAAYLFTFLDDNYDKALDRASAELERIYQRPFRDAAAKYCLLGRPEDMLEQLQDFADAGARQFIFAVPDNHTEFIQTYQDQLKPAIGTLRLDTNSVYIE